MKSFFLTDTGRVRDHNEDSVTILKNANNEYLLAVADGMGGYKGGEIASKLAVACSRSYIENNLKDTPKDKESLIQLIRKQCRICQYGCV